MVSVVWTKFTHIPFIEKGELPSYRRGRIAHIANLSHIAKFIHVANSPMFSITFNGRANCNSPLHVRYPNVSKYYMQIASRAWHEGVCVRRRGELKFAHTAICPYCKIHPCCKFVHIVNSSILQNSSTLQFTHVAIHPHHNLPTSLP